MRGLTPFFHLPSLAIDEEAIKLGQALFDALDIPEKARDDALHIAVACRCKVDYLLSWNFKHIVNASTTRKLRHFIGKTDYPLPQICTPEELIQ